MNRSGVESLIRENAHSHGFHLDEVRAQQDPFTERFWIAVVAPSFAGLELADRKGAVLAGIDESIVEWLDLLTPEEAEWAGGLPSGVDVEDLPLWPEALARANLAAADTERRRPVFPSDLDEDLETPIVATFYSLKGGVGRTTALANTAYLLARRGRRVIAVDMDLEAPGLQWVMGVGEPLGENKGLVWLLNELDSGGDPDPRDHLLRASETDELYVLPAGTPGSAYARALRGISPEEWYQQERNPLHELMRVLSGPKSIAPDVILIDARTGMTSLSGPLLFDLSDLAVIVFYPHPQAHGGTRLLTQGILNSHNRRKGDGAPLTPEPCFVVSPIPASRAPEVEERYRRRAIEWVADWLVDAGADELAVSPAVVEERVHFVSYSEQVATSDSVACEPKAWAAYGAIAEWIEQLLPEAPSGVLTIPSAELKARVLSELDFSAGTAEGQPHFMKDFVRTERVERALGLDCPLVLGRKGTGKTAVFRWLHESEDRPHVVCTAPAGFGKSYPWLLDAEQYKDLGDDLVGQGLDWRVFWPIHVSLCIANQTASGPAELREWAAEASTSSYRWLQAVRGLLADREARLKSAEWLQEMDRTLGAQHVLLFDGLDTGFGHQAQDRERRQRAVEGLFEWLPSVIGRYEMLRPKVLLRYDIWRSLEFGNKSHFFGQSVQLQWEDRADYFLVAIKQALRSPSFRQHVAALPGAPNVERPEHWSDGQINTVWELLVGERMRGGKTSYTNNWVWKRLSDANDDHAPRYLTQLFKGAVETEKAEASRAAYDRSLIRPRLLEHALEEVSVQALEALREEFTELGGLLDRVREIGSMPFGMRELNDDHRELVGLAREVGLLRIYEGTEEDIERLTVPELYRFGLNMKRKGPR